MGINGRDAVFENRNGDQFINTIMENKKRGASTVDRIGNQFISAVIGIYLGGSRHLNRI